jgi:hypothetical protein
MDVINEGAESNITPTNLDERKGGKGGVGETQAAGRVGG